MRVLFLLLPARKQASSHEPQSVNPRNDGSQPHTRHFEKLVALKQSGASLQILLKIIPAHGIITRGIMARNNSVISGIIARGIIVRGKCNNTFPSITACGIIAPSNNLQH